MTNENKHAPGRGWKAVQTSSGWHVSEDGYGMIFRVLPQNRGVDEADRLMGLIAAAPELLAALRECNDVLTKLRQSMRIEGRKEHHRYADHGVTVARAALAKARGVS